MFKSLESYLNLRICLQSFRRVNFTMALSLSLPSDDNHQQRWGQWCSQPSRRLTAPLFLNSCYQLAEVFQPPLNILFLSTGHLLSIDVPLAQFSYKAHCLHTLITTNSAWSLAKLSLNLRISWSMALLSSVILFYSDVTIGISSLFSILSKASPVYCLTYLQGEG